MAARARGTNWELLAIAGAAAAAIYLLWKATGVAKDANNAVSSAIASGVELLTLGPPIAVTGSVDDAAGNVLGPIASFNAAHDSRGNTYLAINGSWYMLGARDARGNFTAIPTGQAVTG